MCGIAGFYQTSFSFTDFPVFKDRLIAMKESLLHRGPDDNGSVLFPHAGLAHTRLSIIDLSGGRQPMTRTYENRTCTIVYNGELYNTKELKELLRPYPLCFQTTSDTEVVLNGFLALGSRFFEAMNGIYAFAIYEEEAKRLTLVRDRLGVKPLFYAVSDGMLLFGSEPKALFAGGLKPKLCFQGIQELFGLGPARIPGSGIFSGVSEVLPGQFLTAEGKLLTAHTYWTLQGREHTDSYEETCRKVRELLYDSIKRQMVSDIPICTFLSGGLDSSLVSAVCAKELKKQGKELHTFSFDFTGNKENFKPNAFQSSADRPYVDTMVSHIGSTHTYLECDSRTQADCLYQAVDAADLPCMADIEASLLYFCSKVATQVRVTLTGECADEIFGGYPWFHEEAALKRPHFPWSYDMAARTALLTDDFAAELRLSSFTEEVYEKSIAKTPRFSGDSAEEARRREIAWLNIRYFMATLLNRMDRTSMYSGLEARIPYADHRILEYVYNIPWEMKCRGGNRKSLLIEAGKGLLPDSVLYRKKSPYPKTYDPNYETLLGKRLMEAVSDSASPLAPYLDRKKLTAFLSSPSDYGRPWYGQLMAGPQLLAWLLQIDYWLRCYRLHF